jgi:hypothetical protein
MTASSQEDRDVPAPIVTRQIKETGPLESIESRLIDLRDSPTRQGPAKQMADYDAALAHVDGWPLGPDPERPRAKD